MACSFAADSRRSLVIAFASLCVLALAAPAHALTQSVQDFELTFVLDSVVDTGTGTPIDPFLLEDLFIEVFAGPEPQFVNLTGAGALNENSIALSHNAAPISDLDSFALDVGDEWGSMQTLDVSTAGLGEALLLQDYGWFMDVENETGFDVTLEFSWSYNRVIDLTEMGDFDDATAFFGPGTLSVDGDESELFAESNIGTLPPGVMLTFPESGSFSIDVPDFDFISTTIEWEIGGRAEDVPEPGALALLGAAAIFARRRR